MTSEWSPSAPWTMGGARRYVLAVGGEQWHVDVALPGPMVAAAAGPGPYPALYVMDGSATFSITAQVVENTLAQCHGLFPAVAVVGISPATDSWERVQQQRLRDFSPSVMDDPLLPDNGYGWGGAEAMLDLVEQTIVPFLEDRHPLDPSDRAISGWSMSGLFAWYALLTRRPLFRRCLAVSPSLWWDDWAFIDPELVAKADLAGADFYLVAGEHEADPDRSWPRPPGGFTEQAAERIRGWDMVAGVERLARQLAERGDVEVASEVLGGEQHGTIWAGGVTRGLVHLYRTDR